ncbi:Glutamyl-tRNA(Gln) amidotransferase subunit B, mitochondrial [Wickerhamiella sorbophila]|uniref:Glutamyl-tRNA(Gln) amidotransferase subunit B, mitochondrial n=1 Tax=Wickerhamiella sorbophila TaxID=45607 RepID=A0A2T0FQ42_9ASCO|nr:Glutamyl-tRNA(Gln) amidotransferase subunit B, mitochondrial [Wickerhamiella sorbophila]PRT57114.1 Glutamyl-tRNA(Gln) amidotransferase subunit B, mitochondrial [Wickerhamiella sorbophila]
MSGHKLKCGLEVHAQLLTKQKLFSSTSTSFHAPPNTRVSYYDAALPGTQPRFNYDCLRLALTAAAALNCDVKRSFSFDRKHYMYPDQPAGYQITQHFEPFAMGGFLDVMARDYSKPRGHPTTRVNIKQIQIEQDTAKTIYVDNVSQVDLNRTNTGLIELVTEPDLPTAESAGVFVKKLQTLLRHLGVCNGEMETGAMRVDVNVSVDDGERCEIKNLFSTSAVVAAIKAEFNRQIRDIESGKVISSETRGWDGKETWKLRGKEGSIDYRYMPDPELPVVRLPDSIVEKIRRSMPALPDQVLDELVAAPYNVPLVDAKTLMDHGMRYVNFYRDSHALFTKSGGKKTSIVSNWLVHRWLGQTETQVFPSVQVFTDLLIAMDKGEITSTSAKLILKHLVGLAESNELTPDVTIKSIIDEFDLGTAEADDQLDAVCAGVIEENPDAANRYRSGKRNAVSFLLGATMKATQGTYSPAQVKSALERLLKN